ncbi:ABC transporter ATP-binding protein [Methyloversatilis thermotolerans]|uniref:ABC transporter ATP-binding protein n=1 Tax=Methyloversatilis thermotolerans TaxID=1346290 RepID=UPI00037050CE|nr:ABC transporter ATP-binding protein [Methyloversatilis thermotolerans]
MPLDLDATVLELRALSKTLPGPPLRRLLDSVDLSVAPGEYVAIVGESGAGKSTLLNLVAALDRPDSGSVCFGDDDVSVLDEDAATLWRRREVGFVFQSFHVLPWLDLADNVALPLALAGAARGERQRRAREALRTVALEGRADDSPTRLSGGELQRVAIARALVHRPRLLLADEPTGNLDADNAERIAALLRNAVKTSTACGLIVTHSAAVAATADRVLRLARDGRLHRA